MQICYRPGHGKVALLLDGQLPAPPVAVHCVVAIHPASDRVACVATDRGFQLRMCDSILGPLKRASCARRLGWHFLVCGRNPAGTSGRSILSLRCSWTVDCGVKCFSISSACLRHGLHRTGLRCNHKLHRTGLRCNPVPFSPGPLRCVCVRLHLLHMLPMPSALIRVHPRPLTPARTSSRTPPPLGHSPPEQKASMDLPWKDQNSSHRFACWYNYPNLLIKHVFIWKNRWEKKTNFIFSGPDVGLLRET